MERQEGIRVNKFLSEAGVCSRREADRALEAGQIRIGERVAVLGDRVRENDTVFYKGKPVRREEEHILIAFHKPRGVVCTTSKKEGVNIVDYIGYPKRIYPVGRLDKDSTGLILLTNDGDIVNKMMRSGNRHEKEYVVTVDRNISNDFIMQMSNGVPILDTVTRPCKVWQTGAREFRIILTQGLNRQIRRMCEALGYRVKTLKRLRIMNICLGSLKEGTYRDVTQEEWRELRQLIRHSSNETVR
ncbi:MAG: pseudouridine synthase [Lachnospiraceae bacterium]